MAFQFGSASRRRMDGVNQWLVLCVTMALSKCKHFDQTVPWMGGLRSAEDQHRIFKNGNSQLDGYNAKSYHQTGNAIDVVPYHNGKIDYNCDKGFREFAAAMFTSWQEILVEFPEARQYKLEYGGHWRNFIDKPHWQLV
ncbi:M15 family metallopeptidase [Flammeovirga sp. MY04]|uniref:M15 family metallopeptidase n=1 Tax=Flammeovirga sp. MY04 TaxID=1191459 RepID=UPI000806430F|nr:M15 family metallopeptidase [Flammeovirga sp. MY04]ANQ49623.1 M15 family metallopeptidase [Flammeovirga sp. MY04]ANQ52141.1 M15 family metallopeptidase [Flammeovirga sp. MY04]